MAQNRSASGAAQPVPSRDARAHSPVFHRNGPIITAHLCGLLSAAAGDVLEIGSGAGQHIAAFAAALPGLTWWPTEADPGRIPSIEAWRRHTRLANLRAPAILDAARTPWRPEPPGPPLGRGLTAIIAVNVVHISPWPATEGIIAGAAAHLASGGCLVLYGPFLRDDAPTAPSNAAFDAQLRARDPAWGLREISALDALAGANGLLPAGATEVPANNLILEFRKPG
ncbi:MAG: class I SAM-dependent methyltransferase [Alphaproteobacteria bacterium]|nr:class I SAM-dependent methyltransferase [Alphaproteobacteria bacterium]